MFSKLNICWKKINNEKTVTFTFLRQPSSFFEAWVTRKVVGMKTLKMFYNNLSLYSTPCSNIKKKDKLNECLFMQMSIKA